MTLRLLLPFLALSALLLPTAALAATPTMSVLAAESEPEHAEESEHAEEADHEVELRNMDNGDPGDAGAQSLVATSPSSFIDVMMLVMGALVLALIVFGLVQGRGRNNL